MATEPSQGEFTQVGKGTVRRWAVVLAVLLGGTVPAADVAAAPTAQPLDEPTATGTAEPDRPEPLSRAARAAALAEPAIVAIEVRWHGYVRDRTTGDLVDAEPVSATAWCSGVGVGGQGYLLTTGSCLQQAAAAREAFNQLVQRRVADGRTPAAQANQLLGELLATATIGHVEDSADPPERSVFVRRTVTNDDPIPATVVSVADPDDGDAALLKINRSSPILPIAESVPVGENVIVIECPAAGGDTGATPTPSAVEEPLNVGYRISVVVEDDPRVLLEQVTPESDSALPNGIVVTAEAGFVGIVDGSLGGREVLVDASVIRELLDNAEVDTDLGQVDRDFRAGLDAYYAGQYTESIEHFDSVLAIIPSHVQAHEYRDQAQERREAQGSDKPKAPDVVDRFNRFVTARSGSLVGIGVLIAILVFLLHSRRPVHAATSARPSEATPTQALEQSPPQAPVSPAAPVVRSPEPREPDQTSA